MREAHLPDDDILELPDSDLELEPDHDAAVPAPRAAPANGGLHQGVRPGGPLPPPRGGVDPLAATRPPDLVRPFDRNDLPPVNPEPMEDAPTRIEHGDNI